MSKSGDCDSVILDYLTKQNRPYSAIDIFNNLHKEYGKTAVVRSLESMAEAGTTRSNRNCNQDVKQRSWNSIFLAPTEEFYELFCHKKERKKRKKKKK